MNNTFHIDRNLIESPLEELFIHQFEKFLNANCQVIPQFKVNTTAGNFRIDFVIKLGELKIAIECDGADFHDEWRDEWRDSMILGGNNVDIIYRFRGKDLTTYLNECIHVIYLNDKKIFSDRYSSVHKSLVDIESMEKEFSELVISKETTYFHLETTDEFGTRTGRHHLIKVIRRDKNDKDQYWNNLFEFAKQNQNQNQNQTLDELIELRKLQRR